MPREVTTGLYEFDPYGDAEDNLIENEKQTLDPPGRDDFYFLIPQAAPFFVKSLEVRNDDTNELYEEGVDYLVGHWFVEAMTKTGRSIAGSIRFINRDISGIVSLTYQTLGDNWGFDDQAILEELSNKLVNPLTRAWAEIDPLPETFPPIPHDQRVDDLIGFEEVVEAVEGIADAMGASEEDDIKDHIESRDNPHNTTKEHVDLGYVSNYPMAGDSEAVDADRSDRYMAPRTTRLLVDPRIQQAIDDHLGKTNPHELTKDDIDLGDVENWRPATEAEAFDGDRNDLYMTPELSHVVMQKFVDNYLQPHVDDENPHGITPELIGAVTQDELDDAMAGSEGYLTDEDTAYNSDRVYGYEFDELQDQILDGTASNADALFGQEPDEFYGNLRDIFTFQKTFPVEYEDPDEAGTDHRWAVLLGVVIGSQPNTFLLRLPGVDNRIAIVELTIPATGTAGHAVSLNAVEPLNPIALGTETPDEGDEQVVLYVDILGTEMDIGIISLQRNNDDRFAWASVGDYSIEDHDSDQHNEITIDYPIDEDRISTIESDVSNLDSELNTVVDELTTAFNDAVNELNA